MSNVLWTEGDRPDPVTPENPLEGLELQVLQTWLRNSRELWTAYQVPANRKATEEAVREAVDQQRVQELTYRAEGLTFDQARELTTPRMWTPPTWPSLTSKPSPTPAAKPLAGS